ncbi:uncharacterized protein H6S33_008533 [Morchella sextelata]|uniref:uncharacterized protein n=1 Tax=Morchella sextelata TaxID=1174677 RepID=UPI001D051793|nr:uncharacterized protein H6S33_008533 [Morchella sextelata]KAH0602883.1 hypothetical protein H6S33_008533 [Morchella sextelata]
MKFSTLISTSAFLVGQALAHGGVTTYVIDGTSYPGWSPYNPATGQSTIQRQYSSYDPLYSPTDAFLKCNTPGTGPAALVATVAAGGTVVAKWAQWTHAEGPVLVYMAKVGDAFADSDGDGLEWFKIDEAGLLSGTVNAGSWGLGEILKNLEWTTTIPANLAPGNYLIRHELIALHQANTPQFYPECAQLTVTGSGTGVPSGDYLTSFPGAYAASDPGITIDIYSSTATTYTIPGPAKWTG